MTINEPEFEEPLQDLLKALDDAPTGTSQSILKNEGDKQYYETILMFAVRRRAAAKYHLDSVIALQKEGDTNLDNASKALAGKHPEQPMSSYASSSFRTAHEFVHELSAFLAALRSGLDFMARVAVRSLPGLKDSDSISSVIKAVQKGASGPLLDDVTEHLDWLSELRSYRDEVIHRLVVQAPMAGWHISHNGKTSVQMLPVVVPRHTPSKFVPDTRAARMMDQELPHGLSLSESHGSVTYPDGAVEVIDHSVEYFAADGFVTIEDFMSLHLTNYDSFMAAILKALAALNFQTANMSTK